MVPSPRAVQPPLGSKEGDYSTRSRLNEWACSGAIGARLETRPGMRHTAVLHDTLLAMLSIGYEILSPEGVLGTVPSNCPVGLGRSADSPQTVPCSVVLGILRDLHSR